jgi:hypothetical protein
MADPAIDSEHRRRRQVKHPGLGSTALEQYFITSVQTNHSRKTPLQVGNSADVIDMSVSQQNVVERKIVIADPLDQSTDCRIITRIDEYSPTSFHTTQQIDILLKKTTDQSFEDQSSRPIFLSKQVVPGLVVATLRSQPSARQAAGD